MAHPVAWFEVTGKDGEKLQKFYADLFGWEIDANNPQKYGIVPAGEGGIGGGIAASQDGSSGVTVYVSVDDLQKALDEAEALGGKAVMGPMEVEGGPTLAFFTDPEGNTIGLMKGM
jgi:uncharacterized protein